MLPAVKADGSSFEAQNIGDDLCLLIGGEHEVGRHAVCVVLSAADNAVGHAGNDRARFLIQIKEFACER